MIQIIQGFELLTREAVDNRLVLSKAEMLSVNDNQMPDTYFAVCTDDKKLYVYNKDSNPSEETGKFTLYKNGSTIESISINGVVLPIENFNVDLPIATASKYGFSMPGYGITAVDGKYSIDFNAIDDGSIPAEKINWENVVIDGTNI